MTKLEKIIRKIPWLRKIFDDYANALFYRGTIEEDKEQKKN